MLGPTHMVTKIYNDSQMIPNCALWLRSHFVGTDTLTHLLDGIAAMCLHRMLALTSLG